MGLNVYSNNPNTVNSPVTYVATLSSATNTAQVIKSYRDGQFLKIDGKITWSGAGGAGTFSMSIPSGLVMDTAFLVGGTTITNQGVTMVGYGYWFDSGNGWLFIYPTYASTTTINFVMNTQLLDGGQLAAGDAINFHIEVPIVGWI